MPLAPIPQQRVVEKLDEYMSRRDYEGAEKHLLYWLEEARALGDERGELMVRNELVGHFRKTGGKEQAFEHAEAALALRTLLRHPLRDSKVAFCRSNTKTDARQYIRLSANKRKNRAISFLLRRL